ncbi:MAG: glycosyltransferase [Erysipelotrichaceae bacterium]|nr:glycosyltransferase [Erysipelotrichaceae bacterium]
MSNPKVSILIPTYNVEPYLVQCMESVTNQTLKDIEIVCINDGSTDNSLKILQEYAAKDSRIVLIDKHNEGYGIGMNIGLEKATGEYIGIVEPDDFVPVEMYGDLYKIASENDLDFVKADFYRFVSNEDGTLDKTLFELSKNKEDYNKVFDPSQTPSALKYVMNTWSGIYKRSFLNEHNIRHNTTPGASYQDNGFWIQTFVFAKRAMIIDKPYYMNRRDNQNSSVYNPNKVYTMNIEYDHIRDILIQHPDIWERFKGMYWYKKFYSYDMTMKRIAPEFKRDYVYRYSREMRRGLLQQEYDESVFTPTAWGNIHFLIDDPEAYYVLNSGAGNAGKRILKLQRELETIKHSRSYKFSKLLLYIPRKIKSLLKKLFGGK